MPPAAEKVAAPAGAPDKTPAVQVRAARCSFSCFARSSSRNLLMPRPAQVAPPGADTGMPPIVLTHGWQRSSGRSLWEVLAPYAAAGLRHVLCTDVQCDGAMRGPNLALYQEACLRFQALSWQASGGVRGAADLAALDRLGVAHAVVGRALLEGAVTLEEVSPYLPGA